jgi:hypothetical protein
MADNKTKPNKISVTDFIEKIENGQKRKDAFALLDFFTKLTEKDPVMWGPSIIGFGSYHYIYDSGREGDMLLTGFSPRKTALTVYIIAGFKEYADLLEKLGKHKTGKSCLYLKKLSDIDMNILKELVSKSMKHIKEKYPD